MRVCFLGACFFIASFIASANLQAAIIQFDLRGNAGTGLLGGNENPAVVTTGTGGETGVGISFNDVSKVLTLNVGWGTVNGFTNISGVATGFHIHQAASSAFTANGGVIVDFLAAASGFTVTNTTTGGGLANQVVTLNAAQETALLGGQLYLNVHTATNGGGEIRGNLVAVPEPTSLCLLGLTTVGVAGLRFRRKKRSLENPSNV